MQPVGLSVAVERGSEHEVRRPIRRAERRSGATRAKSAKPGVSSNAKE
ncbi:hypothetical protein FTUN_0403 [Frigoriglobus tundricola]|uniref:Uncharacterized protein n=1 Tax=Frigoriglobus tundricola TaxID=2774151 RepID=A0A6M5YI15_9BACT|nr:hypothetical protein FTUN_0403 [Frigoriglobus tundricola]